MFTNKDYERVIKLDLIDNTKSLDSMLKLIDKDADTLSILNIEDGLSVRIHGALYYTEAIDTASERESINKGFKKENKLWLKKVQ